MVWTMLIELSWVGLVVVVGCGGWDVEGKMDSKGRFIVSRKGKEEQEERGGSFPFLRFELCPS